MSGLTWDILFHDAKDVSGFIAVGLAVCSLKHCYTKLTSRKKAAQVRSQRSMDLLHRSRLCALQHSAPAMPFKTRGCRRLRSPLQLLCQLPGVVCPGPRSCMPFTCCVCLGPRSCMPFTCLLSLPSMLCRGPLSQLQPQALWHLQVGWCCLCTILPLLGSL